MKVNSTFLVQRYFTKFANEMSLIVEFSTSATLIVWKFCQKVKCMLDEAVGMLACMENLLSFLVAVTFKPTAFLVFWHYFCYLICV